VYVHQLFALALAHDGITADEAWETLRRTPDFAGFARSELDGLIQFLVAEQALTPAAGRLVLGEKAEETFGRRNFMELFAVFSSPISYRVETAAGAPIGTLNQDFVDRLVEGVSSFLLGGRAWVVAHVDYNDRVVRADPAPRGRQPTWGGFLPQFLGYEVCQQILSVLRSTDEYRYLHPSALKSLKTSRSRFEGVLRSRAGGYQTVEGDILWWTFAGGRINSTLRHLLQALHPYLALTADNFVIRFKDASVDQLLELIRELGSGAVWDDEAVWQRVTDALPAYRLSKFQPFLPPGAQGEMLRDYLLDVAATRRWLTTVASEPTEGPATST